MGAVGEGLGAVGVLGASAAAVALARWQVSRELARRNLADQWRQLRLARGAEAQIVAVVTDALTRIHDIGRRP